MSGPVINLIAAVGKSGQIGNNGRLPWRDSEDLKWFREMTMGGVVVVGHRTHRTLPDLDGRKVIIDRRNVEVPDMIALLKEFDRPIWIAGGAATYARWLPFITRSYVSHINFDGRADTFMPALWKSQEN